jgi:hypothetical protein
MRAIFVNFKKIYYEQKINNIDHIDSNKIEQLFKILLLYINNLH